MRPLLAVVKPYGFVPVREWDDDQRAQYPVGSTVHLTIVKGRSPRMHRFYWALVDFVSRATGYDKEALSDELLIRTGRIDSLEFINGTISTRPKRISNMGHVDFKSYVDAAIELLCREYIPEMSADSLLREVEGMLGITYNEAFAAPARKEKNNGSK